MPTVTNCAFRFLKKAQFVTALGIATASYLHSPRVDLIHFWTVFGMVSLRRFPPTLKQMGRSKR